MKSITIDTILTVTGGRLLAGDLSQTINSVTTNSREVKPGGLFVAIRGENTDGHRYLFDAMKVGAAAFTEVEDPCEFVEGHSYILVDDCLQALQSLAAWYRSCFPKIAVIGVTGSVGKTTTKEMIAAAMEREKCVVKTIGNMNSQIGLARMMFELEDKTEVAIFEMGISEPNEMQRLTTIAKPQTVVVTNIGVSHIGQLGSRENIRKEKLNIANECDPGAKVYLWGDNELLHAMHQIDDVVLREETRKHLSHCEIVFYGEREDNAVRAMNIQVKDEHTCFDCLINQETVHLELSVLGIHHVNNALVAFALARQFGVKKEAALEGLLNYQPMAMRGVAKEQNGYVVIDDTYNASPDSMKSGLSVLYAKPCRGRRIAALGDVLELGEASEICHREVGSFIVERQKETPLDVLLTVGPQALWIAEEVEQAGLSLQVHSVSNTEEATAWMKQNIRENDILLVKGSRGMHMDQMVEALLQVDE